MLYRTEHKLYVFNRMLYRNEHKLYVANRMLYWTEHKLYVANRMLYRTEHKLYVFNRMMYRTEHKLYVVNRMLSTVCIKGHVFPLCAKLVSLSCVPATQQTPDLMHLHCILSFSSVLSVSATKCPFILNTDYAFCSHTVKPATCRQPVSQSARTRYISGYNSIIVPSDSVRSLQ
jgi:hypothetical protein